MKHFSGLPFKVISETSGVVFAEFLDREEALACAVHHHRADPDHHFQVVEVKWCGGSKRLSHLRLVNDR